MSPEVLPDPDRLAFAEYVCEAFASHTAHEAVELESLVQRLLPRWQEIARDSCCESARLKSACTDLRTRPDSLAARPEQDGHPPPSSCSG